MWKLEHRSVGSSLADPRRLNAIAVMGKSKNPPDLYHMILKWFNDMKK